MPASTSWSGHCTWPSKHMLPLTIATPQASELLIFYGPHDSLQAQTENEIVACVAGAARVIGSTLCVSDGGVRSVAQLPAVCLQVPTEGKTGCRAR